MSRRPLRVAVVGIGHLGKIHARIYRDNAGADLAFVVDVDEERGGALARELDCQAVGSVSDLPDDIDAVSVVVPTTAHAKIAVPLLERGIPCLVEKPLAANLVEADLILAAAERGGAALAVGHVERFQPGVRRVREMGMAPRFVECHRLSTFGFRSTDVSVVHDLMIHDLDLVMHLVGSPVEALDAAGGSMLTDTEDVASVRLVFANGARANVTASRVSMSAMRRFRMFSSSSYVSLDFQKNYGLMVRKGPRWEAGREELKHIDPTQLSGSEDVVTDGMIEIDELALEGEERPLQKELDSFLNAVREGTEPEVTGADGRRALELAERITAEIRREAW